MQTHPRRYTNASVWLLLSILAGFRSQSVADESPALSWTVFHKVISADKDAEFERRGIITLSLSDEGSTVDLKIVNSEAPASSLVYEDLTEVSTPKLYQIKVVSDTDSNLVPVTTTVPACQVVLSKYRDEFILSFGQNANLLSVAYVPLVSHLAPKSCQQLENITKANTFDSKISYETTTPAMTLRTVLPPMTKPPPGLKFFAKVNPHGPGSPGGAEPEPLTGPGGFFKRYWYIILPIMLMNIFGQAPPAEEGGDQVEGGEGSVPPQGSAGAGATGVATAGTASPAARMTTTSPSSGAKRRGKRG